jgi:hypothetical protein
MHKEIDVLDRWVDILAQVFQYPRGISIRLASFFVRLTESRDVGKIIDVLAQGEPSNLRIGTDLLKN